MRIIDYKTGKDELDFESVASLFIREGKRNKAAFQTLLYALMYVDAESGRDVNGKTRVVPGLINRMNLFDQGFTFGLKLNRQAVDDVHRLFPEFKHHLKLLLEELFDPTIPFDQTSDPEPCKYCPYSSICYR